MSQVIAFSVASIRKYDRSANAREADPAYLRFIREQPCTIQTCKSRFQEAAHTGGRGLSRKANDHQAIPLCPFHHRTGSRSFHQLGRRGFEAFYKLDINAIVKELNEWYEMENRR